MPGYVAALVEALRARRVTTLAIREGAHLVAVGPEEATDTLAVLAENVLLLQQVTVGDRLRRLLSAPKMRFSAHDLRIREFMITPPGGIQVLAPVTPAEDGNGDRATPLALWAEGDAARRRGGGDPDPDRGG